jgi:regulator of sirC expression with transglutaminase-like and TPR domain
MNDESSHKELDALISLIDEPSDRVYRTIREKISAYGLSAIPSLEHAWENAFDPVIQQRIEELIHNIQFDQLKRDLAEWLHDQSGDLLRGYILVSRYQYPDMDQGLIIRKIGRITQDVWLELNSDRTALEKVKVINHILYDIYKFTGNFTNINAPENFYITNLLEGKKGTPLSLGILFIIIAQSLKIPVFGVDFPKHFILAYADGVIKEAGTMPDGEMLFYINPFNRGAVFTRNEIDQFIRQFKLEKEEDFFRPCSNKAIIKRLIGELAAVHDLAGNSNKKEELEELLSLFEV